MLRLYLLSIGVILLAAAALSAIARVQTIRRQKRFGRCRNRPLGLSRLGCWADRWDRRADPASFAAEKERGVKQKFPSVFGFSLSAST